MVPQSTPTDTLYIETGLLDISTITTKNRLNMDKIIQKPQERPKTQYLLNNTTWKPGIRKTYEQTN